jgi:hypothetical protein
MFYVNKKTSRETKNQIKLCKEENELLEEKMKVVSTHLELLDTQLKDALVLMMHQNKRS